MTTNIVDRRQNPKDKSLGSRQRFLKRAKEQVKKAVQESVANTDIKDFGKGSVRVPVKGISEPTFNHDPKTGHRKAVVGGNKDFIENDRIKKPDGGQGSGSEASDDGEGEDEFTFVLSKEEFIDAFFDDLELPNMVDKQIKELLKSAPKRAGYTSSGNPANMSIAATVKKSIARRLALGRPKQEEIDALRAQLESPYDREHLTWLRLEIARLEQKRMAIPYIDKVDLRYRNFVQHPKPCSQAVMILLMDVSGSMGEREKDIAKRFYILLYLLLHKKYEKVEIVFVRHHHNAEECTEHEFFHKQETGGTIVSVGLKLVNQIIDARYSPVDWNIYMAQASDGDNFSSDAQACGNELENLLPRCQYMTYLDIPHAYANGTSDLWGMYEIVADMFDNVAMASARDAADIWPIFQGLFSKERA